MDFSFKTRDLLFGVCAVCLFFSAVRLGLQLFHDRSLMCALNPDEPHHFHMELSELFAEDSYDLLEKNPKLVAVLENAKAAKKVEISVDFDFPSDESLNLAISRGFSVIDFLVTKGVTREKLVLIQKFVPKENTPKLSVFITD